MAGDVLQQAHSHSPIRNNPLLDQHLTVPLANTAHECLSPAAIEVAVLTSLTVTGVRDSMRACNSSKSYGATDPADSVATDRSDTDALGDRVAPGVQTRTRPCPLIRRVSRSFPDLDLIAAVKPPSPVVLRVDRIPRAFDRALRPGSAC